ncbi:MAG: recombinase family protein [Solirubrobacteraceae bacterium]
MRVAIYARVSTERQEERGTIGSQLELLRAAARDGGDDVVAEFVDDGYSGSRLDRPALDRLRDAAEAGALDTVLCLCPDRLARAYAYQVLILEELERFGVTVRFLDGPAPGDDPQAKLLVQVQGVIAEYERAKIAERYRRGKLHRARAGEVFFWKVPYGYRRVGPAPGRPAHMEIYEPEAEIVRWIFRAYVEETRSIRQVAHDLYDRGVPSPTGKPVWGTSTLQRLLANEAYIGRVYYNRRETINGAPAHRGARRAKTRYRDRPREEWITIPVPTIIDQDTFQRARQVRRENPKWSPRGIEPGHWLLRGLIECGHCHVGCNCHKMRGRNGTFHRYYYCRNHDILRAGGEHLRCPERNIRADDLDAYVFTQVRRALLEPSQLIAGERAVITTIPPNDDDLIGTQLAALERKLEQTELERRRLLDAYQAALLDLDELTRRTATLTARRDQLAAEHADLTARRADLARENRLRRGIAGFAERVLASLDELDFDGRQRLLRIVVEKVQVTGWRVEIHLKIPLTDDNPPTPREPRPPKPDPRPSSDMGLRSVDHHRRRRQLPARPGHRRQGGQAPDLTLNLSPCWWGDSSPPAGRKTWPPVGNFVAAVGENSMAIDTPRHRTHVRTGATRMLISIRWHKRWLASSVVGKNCEQSQLFMRNWSLGDGRAAAAAIWLPRQLSAPRLAPRRGVLADPAHSHHGLQPTLSQNQCLAQKVTHNC